MTHKSNTSASRIRLSGPICATLILAIAGTPVLAQNSGNSTQEAKPAEAGNQADLPSVEKLTEMVVKAIGGRENVDKVKTLHTVIEMNIQGMSMSMESKWGREGGRWSKNSFAGGEMGTDGTTAWSKTAGGAYNLLGDAQAVELNSQASMHMMMMDPEQLKKNMENMEVVGREEFDGRMCYKLRFQPEHAETPSYMFFDVSDGLPRGMMETQQGLSGQPETSKIMLGDWKTVEGVKFFYSMKAQSPGIPGGTAEMKVTTLEVNKLDEDVFELPAEVKELAANAENSNEDVNASDDADEITLEDLPEAYRDRAKTAVDQMKMGGKQAIERSLPQLESALSSLPEGDDKRTLQYIIQELKKVK